MVFFFFTHSLMFSHDFSSFPCFCLVIKKKKPKHIQSLCVGSNLSECSPKNYCETNPTQCNNTSQKPSGSFQLPPHLHMSVCPLHSQQGHHSTSHKCGHGSLGFTRLLQGNPRGHDYFHHNNPCQKKWTSAEVTEHVRSQQMD